MHNSLTKAYGLFFLIDKKGNIRKRVLEKCDGRPAETAGSGIWLRLYLFECLQKIKQSLPVSRKIDEYGERVIAQKEDFLRYE